MSSLSCNGMWFCPKWMTFYCAIFRHLFCSLLVINFDSFRVRKNFRKFIRKKNETINLEVDFSVVLLNFCEIGVRYSRYTDFIRFVTSSIFLALSPLGIIILWFRQYDRGGNIPDFYLNPGQILSIQTHRIIPMITPLPNCLFFASAVDISMRFHYLIQQMSPVEKGYHLSSLGTLVTH